MKTIALISAFFLLSLSNNANNDSEKDMIGKKISQALTMPESLKQKSQNEKVSIRFVVNESGNVSEVNALTKDLQAKRDLEAQFMKLTFKGLPACVTNSIDIHFVLR
jgi:hypothetical protein